MAEEEAADFGLIYMFSSGRKKGWVFVTEDNHTLLLYYKTICLYAGSSIK